MPVGAAVSKEIPDTETIDSIDELEGGGGTLFNGSTEDTFVEALFINFRFKSKGFYSYAAKWILRDVRENGTAFEKGDSLKFGVALYQTGTPIGEKWAEQLYKERIFYYGEALLNKYFAELITNNIKG